MAYKDSSLLDSIDVTSLADDHSLMEDDKSETSSELKAKRSKFIQSQRRKAVLLKLQTLNKSGTLVNVPPRQSITDKRMSLKNSTIWNKKKYPSGQQKANMSMQFERTSIPEERGQIPKIKKGRYTNSRSSQKHIPGSMTLSTDYQDIKLSPKPKGLLFSKKRKINNYVSPISKFTKGMAKFSVVRHLSLPESPTASSPEKLTEREPITSGQMKIKLLENKSKLDNYAMEYFGYMMKIPANKVRDNLILHKKELEEYFNTLGPLGFLKQSLIQYFMPKYHQINMKKYLKILKMGICGQDLNIQRIICFSILDYKRETHIHISHLFNLLKEECSFLIWNDLLTMIKQVDMNYKKPLHLRSNTQEILYKKEYKNDLGEFGLWGTIAKRLIKGRPMTQGGKAIHRSCNTSVLEEKHSLLNEFTPQPAPESEKEESSEEELYPQREYLKNPKKYYAKKIMEHDTGMISFQEYSKMIFDNKNIPDLLLVIIRIMYGPKVLAYFCKKQKIMPLKLENSDYGLQFRKVYKKTKIEEHKQKTLLNQMIEDYDPRSSDNHEGIATLFWELRGNDPARPLLITEKSFINQSKILFGTSTPVPNLARSLFHAIKPSLRNFLSVNDFMDLVLMIMGLRNEEKLLNIGFDFYDIDKNKKICSTDLSYFTDTHEGKLIKQIHVLPHTRYSELHKVPQLEEEFKILETTLREQIRYKKIFAKDEKYITKFLFKSLIGGKFSSLILLLRTNFTQFIQKRRKTQLDEGPYSIINIQELRKIKRRQQTKLMKDIQDH